MTGIWVLHRWTVNVGLSEMSFDTHLADQVVQGILTKALLPNASGVLKLPAKFAKVVVADEVYVTVDSAGTTWILFRLWRGKGCNLRGMLYRNTPANGTPPRTINVLVRLPASPPSPTTGYVDLNVEEQIDPNWYRVYSDLD